MLIIVEFKRDATMQQRAKNIEAASMRQLFNFNAGPAMLPEEVLLQAQAEMLDWHHTGMSIMEVGHRDKAFKELAQESESLLRELMSIPSNYKVLFLPGGATTQFAMVPLNLLRDKKSADYVETGVWSKKAVAEANRYCDVNVAARTQQKDGISYLPQQADWQLNTDAAYVHYTPNETIDGIEFHWVPQTGEIPLVADMTSMCLSRPIDVNQFGVIYAGAQKNLGQAGITVVIIREDLINDPMPKTPTLYSYQVHAEHESLYNTPPTYAWYICGLVLQWTKNQGGVAAIHTINERKAKTLYDIIDQFPDFYINQVEPSCRSIMNVVFRLPEQTLSEIFLTEAAKIGLVNLRGHRASGGIRASIYNAMPEKGVKKLADFMREFIKNKG